MDMRKTPGRVFRDLLKNEKPVRIVGKINTLAAMMAEQIEHRPIYTLDYHNPNIMSIANSNQVFLKVGPSTDKVKLKYPLGHKRRREAKPLLESKFRKNMNTLFGPYLINDLLDLFNDTNRINKLPINLLIDLLVRK
ncbi:MAG: hypothetical protein ACFE8N_06855 [Promethearchaeota archaeon]